MNHLTNRTLLARRMAVETNRDERTLSTMFLLALCVCVPMRENEELELVATTDQVLGT